MKHVDATLPNGASAIITQESFVAAVERGADFTLHGPVEATLGGGLRVIVNPRFITHLYLVEDGKVWK